MFTFAPAAPAEVEPGDDVPGTTGVDNLYYNAIAAKLTPGTYSVVRLELSRNPRPFLSAENLAQTCALFDAVIWYRGASDHFSLLMRQDQDALASYLDHGGHLMIEARLLIAGTATDIELTAPTTPGAISAAEGALREDAQAPHWVTRYFGSTALIRAPLTGIADSTVIWGINFGSILQSSKYDLTVLNTPIIGGLRGFALRDTHNVVLWARENQLTPAVARDIPVAISVPVPDNPPGLGRVILFTLPIVGLNGFGNAAILLDNALNDLGLGP